MKWGYQTPASKCNHKLLGYYNYAEKNEPLPIKLLRYFLFILRALIANNGHDNNSVVMKGLQYYQI